MRIGIGLPAAVPDVDARAIRDWAEHAERAGFASVGVIDRLVYNNLEPLTTLAAAAACTQRVELITTVLNVGWRGNAVLLAKQLATVDLLSGGRLVAGLGLGGWPDDFAASAIGQAGMGALLDRTLSTMHSAWRGDLRAAGGPMRALPPNRPTLLFGGLVPAAFKRAATKGEGWVAPLLGMQLLETGASAVRQAWADAGRPGAPRIVTGRYVSLGPHAESVADEYLRHYYGEAYYHAARADTLTSRDQLADALAQLEQAGVSDLLLYPCSAERDQLERLTDALPTLAPSAAR
jgi:alkanesulfonate monooxygenase SsuD/methylene tetrahydromethanopterin reductase-like flavin-dependent oxidoreductase (luciferase family)